MGELVSRYRDRLVAFCYRWLGQRQDAEDAAQETLIRACRHLPHWDASREFEPWLMAIAGNRCRTALAARRRRLSVVPLPETGVADPRPATTGETLLEEVRLALRELRSEYREAFLLFHDEHLGYAEISQRMDVPIGTVKTWVHRARKELTAVLARRREPEERGAGHVV